MGPRRALSWPIFGLSLVAIAANAEAANGAAPPVAHVAAALPRGGVVAAGSATIGASGGSSLTIDQTSARAIIDWSSFSIGAGAAVRFDNGTGATLNRVTGASASTIDGLLSGTGSVYVLDPHGVIIGKSGVVATGGSFVASTLGLADSQFLAGGPLAFSGVSAASVVNLGRIGALGGDVALIAATVSNQGEIDAAGGSAGLLAGYRVLISDQNSDNGKFSVLLGGASTSATNAGVIAAAEVELRANGGNVYALAGNTGGLIKATGVSAAGGKVFLVAEGGALSLAGTIQASGANGAGGSIETSASTVRIGQASIDAGRGGLWRLDPNDLTINQTAANTIAASLDTGTSVTQQTTAGGTGGNGDIFVSPSVTLDWTTPASLTLSAYRNISLGAGSQLKSTGGGGVTLQADDTGTGTGTVSFGTGAKVTTAGAVNIFYDPTSYASPTSYAASVSAKPLTAWMLVNTLANLQAISTNLAGDYAVGADIDASASAAMNSGAGFAPIGTSATPFKGLFDGQGHAINGLTINRPTTSYVGLFGDVTASSTIENVGVAGESVSGASYVGGLAGAMGGSIAGSNVSGVIAGAGVHVGALAGFDSGGVTQSWAGGSVSGAGSVGGVVGYDTGSISQSYALGAVSGSGAAADVGGLIGYSKATVSQTYATGAVTGSSAVGGLIGLGAGGSVASSYWDTQTTGQAASAGGGVGLSTAQFFTAANLPGFTFGTSPGAAGWVIVDANETLNNAGGAAGNTRPLLLSEYSTTVGNAHQLQLMELNLAASYTLGGDIDASATSGANAAGVWTTAGFVPIGSSATAASGAPFTGVFNGLGYTISDLSIDRPTTSFVGLLGDTTGAATIDNVALAAESVSGAGYVGGLVGAAGGSITASSVSGVITGAGAQEVGGLAGYVAGSINQSGASGSVTSSGLGGYVGGLVGYVGGPISQSWSSASVSSGGSYVGGLVGYAGGAISQSSASGPVSAFGSYVGGVAGGADAITQSWASGSVTDTGTQPYGAVGGLVGYDYGSITRSWATGSVTSAGDAIGGLVGRQYGGSVNQSWASGAVSGGGSDAGGLVGDMGEGGGAVIQSYATGAVSGTSTVGGLVAEVQNGATVSQSWASGAVSGGGYYAGGLVGFAVGVPVTSSYWDTQTTGQANSAGGGVGLTTAQFLTAANFPGLTFGTTPGAAGWVIVDGNGTLNNAGGVAGNTRPMLLDEYSTTVDNAHQLQLMALNLGASYALGADIDASATSGANASGMWTTVGFVPIGSSATPFRGLLNGQGFAITGLAIDRPTTSFVGLFGDVGSSSMIENAGLAGERVSGAGYVGGLVGAAGGGSILASWVTGTVIGSGAHVGGLAGFDTGSIGGSWAGGSVSGPGSVGGLVGYDTGAISQSYALDTVSATGGEVGGLIGYSKATVSQAYAIGQVKGSSAVGGLIGLSAGGSVASSYWDTQTTGQPTSAGGGTGLTTAQFFTAANFAGFGFGTTPGASGWVIVDGDGTLNNAGGFAGATRPMLLSEYSTTISNGHQLQLMELNPAANYTLDTDLNLAATANTTDVWNPASGFVPIGGNRAADFTGLFDGGGHTISNLTIDFTTAVPQTPLVGPMSNGFVGLFSSVAAGGVVRDINLANAKVTAGAGMTAAALVGGMTGGTVIDASSSGAVTTGAGSTSAYNAGAGGLVGGMSLGASIVDSHSSATVTGGNGVIVGGLLDFLGSGSSVISSFATGNVTAGNGASVSQSALAGGLIGEIGGNFPISNQTATVTDSYATGNVTAGGQSAAGGFVGYGAHGVISQSYATGTVTQTASGMNGGGNEIGGFAGDLDVSGNVTRSYSSGAVVTQAGATSTAFTLAGGFAGYAYGTSISDSYATSPVTVQGSGYNLIGGFVGYETGASAITRVIAAGKVTGSYVLGGLVGDLNGGSITDSYWDEGTTGLTVAVASCCDTGTTSGLVGMGGTTGVSPYSESTYAGFDFTNVWSPPSAGHYPTLRGVGPP